MFSNLSPRQLGYSAAIASPALWGFAPIFFHFLTAFALDEILAHRALWAAVFMTGLYFLLGEGGGIIQRHSKQKTIAGADGGGVPCHHKLDGLFGSSWQWSYC